MREIRFRGKRVDDGEWVVGYYVAHDMSVINHDIRHLIICNHQMSDMHPVIPETVGQFTGLQDKNGKDIYEGDKVKIHNITNPYFHMDEIGDMYIKYSKESAHYRLVDKHGEFGTFDEIGVSYIEIIGNIHEPTKEIS